MRFHLLSILCLMTLLALSAVADEATTQRYYEQLQKRPVPGTIFDRYVDAWLVNQSLEKLAEHLDAKTRAPAATPADWRILALLQIRQSDDAAALQSLQKALSLLPGDIDCLLQIAEAQMRLADFEAVVKTVDADPKLSRSAKAEDFAKLKCRALIRLQRVPEALKVLTELATAQPADLDLGDDITELLVDSALLKEAAAYASEVIARTTDAYQKAARMLRLGDLQSRLQDKSAALRTFGEVLSVAGQDSWIEADVLSRLEAVFRREDDLPGLIDHLKSLEKQHPQRASLTLALAESLADQGMKEEALSTFLRLIEKNPGRDDLKEATLALLVRMGRIKDAIVQAQALLARRAGDKELLLRIARLHHEASDPAARDAVVDQFLALPTADEADHLRAARFMAECLDFPAERSRLEAAAKRFPGSRPIREALAVHFIANDDKGRGLPMIGDLIQTGSVEDVLRMTQMLVTRRETRAAQDMASAREKDFGSEPRFLAVLLSAAQINKDKVNTRRLALARLALIQDRSQVRAAVQQAASTWEREERPAAIAELKTKAAITLQERLLLAELLLQSGEQADAVKLLEGGREAVCLETLITVHQAAGQHKEALAVSQKLLDLPGERNVAGLRRHIGLLQRSENPALALPLVQEWKKLSPSSPEAWRMESQSHAMMGKPELALDTLRLAVRKFEKDNELAAELARQALAQNKPDEAVAIYTQLYDRAEDAADRLRYVGALAEAAQYQGKLPALIARFQERQRGNRGSAVAWLALSILHQSAGDDESQCRCLYEASQLRPKDLDLLRQIARLEEERGLYADALRTMEAAAKLDKTASTREAIARHHIEHGDADIGYGMVFELAGGDKADPRSLEDMADALASAGEWERVLTFLKPLIARFPEDYRLGYLYSIAQEEVGDIKGAVETLLPLLKISKELPSTQVQQQVTTNQALGLPPVQDEWQTLPYLVQQTYQYRQQQRGSSWRYRSSSRGQNAPKQTFVMMPPQLAAVSGFVAARCLALAEELDAAAKVALGAKLAAAGVEDGEILIQLSVAQERVQADAPLLDAHPTHRRLHLLWLSSDDNDPKRLEHCFDLFLQDQPDVAFQAVYKGMGDSESLRQKALQVLQQVTKPGPADISRLSSVISVSIRLGDDDNYHQALEKIVDDWAADGSAELRSVAGLYHGLGSWKKWVASLERLAEEKTPTEKPVVLPWQHQGWGRYGLGASMMQTPPPEEFSLPATVLQMLPVYPGGESEQLEQMTSAIAPLIPAVKHPGLKLLLSLRFLPDGVATMEKHVKARLADKPDKQSRLLAAWFASYQGHRLEAAEHLRQVLDLTQDSAHQTSLRFTILQQLQQVSDEREKDAPRAKVLLEYLLTVTNRQPDELQSLLAAAQQWGLEDLTQKLTPQPNRMSQRVAQPLVANPYSQQTSPVKTRPQGPEAIIQHLNDKQPDAAKAELIKQVRFMAGQWLDPQQFSDAEYRWRQLQESLLREHQEWFRQTTASIAKDVKAVSPASTLSAAMAEMLGEKELALSAYEAVIRTGRNKPEVVARLLMLQPELDLSLLDRLPKNQEQNLFPFLIQLSGRSRDQEAMAQRMSLILTALLNRAADQGRHFTPSQVNQVPSFFIGSSDGSLYQLRPQEKPFPVAVRAAHDAFCLALTRHRELAHIGFAPLAGLALRDGARLEEMATLATTIISNARRGQNQNWHSQPQQENEIEKPSPLLFLIRHVALQRPAELETKVYPLIAEKLGPAAVKTARSLGGLYTSKEADFPSAARAWIKAQKQTGWNGDDLNGVLVVWRQRKLSVPLDEFFLPGKSTNNLPNDAAAYATELYERAGVEGAQRFIRKLRDSFTSKESADRRKLLSEAIQRSRGSTSRNNSASAQRAQAYVYWLQNLSEKLPATALLPFCAEDGLVDDEEWFSTLAYRWTREDLNKTPTDWLKTARSLRLFDPPATMRLWARRGSDSSLFDQHVDSGEQLGEVLADALKNQPPGLGRDLALAVITRPRSGETSFLRVTAESMIMDALKLHMAEVERLSEPGALDLAQFLNRRVPGWGRVDDPKLAAALQHLEAALASADIAGLEVILTASSWESLPQELQNERVTFPRLRSLVKKDRARALEILQKLLVLKRGSKEEADAKRQGQCPLTKLPSARLLAAAGAVPELLSEILAEADKTELLMSQLWCGELLHAFANNEMLQKPGVVEALFDPRLPWMQDASAFRDPIQEPASHGSMAHEICNILAYTNDKKLASLAKQALAKADPTFGRGWVDAMLAGCILKHSARGGFKKHGSLRKYLAEHEEELGALSGEAAFSILAVLVDRPGRGRISSDGRWVEVLHDLRGGMLTARAKVFASAENVESLGIELIETESQALEVIIEIAPRDKDLALKVLDQVSRLVLAENAAQDPASSKLALTHWLQQAFIIPTLAGEVLRRLKEAQVDDKVLNQLLVSTLSNLESGLPEDWMLIMKSLGWLGSVEEFKAYPMQSTSETTSALGVWKQRAEKRSPEFVRDLQTSLQTEKSFGRQILTVLSGPSSDAESILGSAALADDMLKLPEPDRLEVLRLLSQRVGGAKNLAGLMPTLGASLNPLVAEAAVGAAKAVTELWAEMIQPDPTTDPIFNKWSRYGLRRFGEGWRFDDFVWHSARVRPEDRRIEVVKKDGKTYLQTNGKDFGFTEFGKMIGSAWTAEPVIARKLLERYIGMVVESRSMHEGVQPISAGVDPYSGTLMAVITTEPHSVPVVHGLVVRYKQSKCQDLEGLLREALAPMQDAATADGLVKAYDSLGLLAAVDSFDPMGAWMGGSKSVLEMAIDRVELKALQDPKVRSGAAEILKRRQQQTFGVRLLAGLVGGDRKAVEVLFHEEAAALAQWPPVRSEPLQTAALRVWPDEWKVATQAPPFDALLARLKRSESHSDLGMNQADFARKLLEVMEPWLKKQDYRPLLPMVAAAASLKASITADTERLHVAEDSSDLLFTHLTNASEGNLSILGLMMSFAAESGPQGSTDLVLRASQLMMHHAAARGVVFSPEAVVMTLNEEVAAAMTKDTDEAMTLALATAFIDQLRQAIPQQQLIQCADGWGKAPKGSLTEWCSIVSKLFEQPDKHENLWRRVADVVGGDGRTPDVRSRIVATLARQGTVPPLYVTEAWVAASVQSRNVASALFKPHGLVGAFCGMEATEEWKRMASLVVKGLGDRTAYWEALQLKSILQIRLGMERSKHEALTLATAFHLLLAGQVEEVAAWLNANEPFDSTQPDMPRHPNWQLPAIPEVTLQKLRDAISTADRKWYVEFIALGPEQNFHQGREMGHMPSASCDRCVKLSRLALKKDAFQRESERLRFLHILASRCPLVLVEAAKSDCELPDSFYPAVTLLRQEAGLPVKDEALKKLSSLDGSNGGFLSTGEPELPHLLERLWIHGHLREPKWFLPFNEVRHGYGFSNRDDRWRLMGSIVSTLEKYWKPGPTKAAGFQLRTTYPNRFGLAAHWMRGDAQFDDAERFVALLKDLESSEKGGFSLHNLGPIMEDRIRSHPGDPRRLLELDSDDAKRKQGMGFATGVFAIRAGYHDIAAKVLPNEVIARWQVYPWGAEQRLLATTNGKDLPAAAVSTHTSISHTSERDQPFLKSLTERRRQNVIDKQRER